MKHTINSANTVAKDDTYRLQPMSTCPVGVKVQLENPGGVLVYGTWNGKDTYWKSWAPLPGRRLVNDD